MVELRDFVAEAISQVMEGVVQAQRRVHPLGGYVNPIDVESRIGSDGRKGVRFTQVPATGPYLYEITDVQFDVAVTATESSQKKGGIGVLSSVVNVGGSKSSEGSMEYATRIKFTIPVAFPHYPAYDLKTKQIVTDPTLPHQASTPQPSQGPLP